MIDDPSQRELFEEYAKITDMDVDHIWKPMDSDLPAKLHATNAIRDAAHPLLPFTSQGTLMALEDAGLFLGFLEFFVVVLYSFCLLSRRLW